jgi:hypothetical protein
MFAEKTHPIWQGMAPDGFKYIHSGFNFIQRLGCQFRLSNRKLGILWFGITCRSSHIKSLPIKKDTRPGL